jgi:FtsZ-interacting cell division protein ZipA
LDTTVVIIIAVVVVVVILLLAIYLISRRRRSQRREEHRERTRREFGSEYDRAAEERGSEERAERELTERRSRVERRVVTLSEEERGRHAQRWEEVERVFVENPERSVEIADRTVTELLEERNFVADPAQDDAETEADLAVMHPEVAEDYREARRIRADVVSGAYRSSTGEGSPEETTENLRQAIRRYRAVHEKLLRN